MTEIVIARRDGVVTAPDGTRYRTHKGRTLADARHPIVVAYPKDWMPMRIDLTVDGDTPAVTGDPTNTAASELDDLRNEFAEVEELAEHRGNELVRLIDALSERSLVPVDVVQRPGWVVDLAIEHLPAPPPNLAQDAPPAEAPVAAPRPSRKRAPGTPGGKAGSDD